MVFRHVIGRPILIAPLLVAGLMLVIATICLYPISN